MLFSAESKKNYAYHYLEACNNKLPTRQNNGEIILDKHFQDEQTIEINLDRKKNDNIKAV